MGNTSIAADVLSQLPNNGNQETTHETMYTTETMLEPYNIKELPESTFTISFNLIDRYQQEDPFLTKKLKCVEYSKGYFCLCCSTIKLITYKDKIVIPRLLKKYVVKLYHTYLLHPVLDRTEAIIHQHLYYPGIREAVYIEVMKCDVCQRTKRLIK